MRSLHCFCVFCIVGLQCAVGFINFPGLNTGCNQGSDVRSQSSICKTKHTKGVVFSTRTALKALSASDLSSGQSISTLRDLRKYVDGISRSEFQTGSVTMMNILFIVSKLTSDGIIENVQAVWDVVSSLEEKDCKPNAMAVSLLMQTCVRLTSIGKASISDGMRILEWAQKHGVSMDTVLYTLQMDIIAKAAAVGDASIHQAFDVLTMMERDKIPPNVITFTALLDVCANLIARQKADLADLNRALTAMRTAEVQPNDKTVTALLAAYAAAAANGQPILDEARHALEAVHRDREADSGAMSSMPLPPYTAAYNALLDVHAKSVPSGQVAWPDCLSLLELMKARGVARDVITYHTLLESARRLAGRGLATVADGWDVIAAMEADGVAPTAECFHSLMSLCAKAAGVGAAGLEDARRVRAGMAARGLPVSTLTFATEMDVVVRLAARQAAGMKEGLVLLQEMRGLGIAPDTSVCNALMQVHAKSAAFGLSKPEDGIGLLTWMQQLGARPDTITFNTLLDLCAKAARTGRARLRHGEDVLERMARCGLAPDSYTLTTFLQLARADGSPDALREAARRFEAAAPGLRTHRAYAAMIAALARDGGRLAAARALLDEAAAAGVAPNRYMYNAALHACESPAQLLALRERMAAAGVEGDEVTDRLVERARLGQVPGRRPPPPNDPLRRAGGAAREKSFKDGLVSL